MSPITSSSISHGRRRTHQVKRRASRCHRLRSLLLSPPPDKRVLDQLIGRPCQRMPKRSECFNHSVGDTARLRRRRRSKRVDEHLRTAARIRAGDHAPHHPRLDRQHSPFMLVSRKIQLFERLQPQQEWQRGCHTTPVEPAVRLRHASVTSRDTPVHGLVGNAIEMQLVPTSRAFDSERRCVLGFQSLASSEMVLLDRPTDRPTGLRLSRCTFPAPAAIRPVVSERGHVLSDALSSSGLALSHLACRAPVGGPTGDPVCPEACAAAWTTCIWL
jgi:hypothetical protein